jgi:hypothetical protein|tara:strand:- start:1295 stop:1531 length:237 start_codon:yes stop_codon:yes gene_type:complete
MNKESVEITQYDSGIYRVEMTDKYGEWTSLGAETMEEVDKYIEEYMSSADKRYKSRESWGKCVQKLIEDDRKHGRSWE